MPTSETQRSQLSWVGTLFAVVLGAVVTIGCGQILGVDEYSIDPTNGASRCDKLHAPDTTGGCRTVVGVPASACTNGFASDGNGGCKDGLPSATPCPNGEIAGPGLQCGALGVCPIDSPYYTTPATETLPDGGFGPLFSSTQTLYVNGAASGGEDGSEQAPFQTIGKAIDAAGSARTLILVHAGTYTESLNIKSAPITIIGTGNSDCPSPVVLQAPKSTGPAVHVSTSAAAGTSFVFFQIVGGSPGLAIDGTESVWLADMWIHDTNGPGIIMMDDNGGAASAHLNGNVLVERAVGAGVELYGSKLDAAVDATTSFGGLFVRGTQPLSDGREGYGVALHPDPISAPNASPDTAKQSELVMSGAVLEGNAGAGLLVEGSNATVTNSVIRNTHANGLGEGRGIVVQRRPLGPVSASLTLTDSIVEQSHDVGVLVIDSPAPLNGTAGVKATITNTTIRDVGNDSTDGGGAGACTGTGLRVRSDGFRTANGPPIVLQNSLIDNARQEGIHVLGARVDVLQSIVRDTTGCGGSLGGDGIAAYADQAMATKVNVTQSRVETSARAGIAAFGAAMNVTSSIVDGCGTVPIAKVTRGGLDASVQVTQGGCGCKSVNAACNAESPATAPAPSLIGGNGCVAFPDGVCWTTCWEDGVQRVGHSGADPSKAILPLGNLVLWAPDNLNVAPALADPATSPTAGCTHWGGLPPGESLVFALGRDHDPSNPNSVGYIPFIWRESTGSHSANFGLESALDNALAWTATFTVDAQLDARTAPTVVVVVAAQSEQADLTKGEDVLLNHGIPGVQLQPPVSGLGPPEVFYAGPTGGLVPNTAMTTAGSGFFFNAAPDEAVVKLVPPPGSTNFHCTGPWDAIPDDKGWTVNKVIAPDMVQVLTRPGFNTTVYALCSVE